MDDGLASGRGLRGMATDGEMCVGMELEMDLQDGSAAGGGTTTEKGHALSRPRAQMYSGRRRCGVRSAAVGALLALPGALAQECIPLEGSSACGSGFGAASISTGGALAGIFPFLAEVTDTESFDEGLQSYIGGGFAEQRYGRLIGCSNFQTDNTTDFYARYTTSVLCNAIVQNSIEACALSGEATRPLCADDCATYAQSEQEITASDVCGESSENAVSQIRADFTNCALPADALTGDCMTAAENQPDDCGYTDNLSGLCGYCASSSPNATDSCCVFSDTESRCEDVSLPIVASSSLRPITVTATSASETGSPTAGAAAASSNEGLTGGQIAGIVVGAVLGALLLLSLVIAGCLFFRRRRDNNSTSSVFNQPSTSRQQPMAFNDGARDQERAGLAVLPGGRVARMAALEGPSSSDNALGKGAPAAAGAYVTSDDEDYSPESRHGEGLAKPPNKRSGSLSSGSQLAMISGANPHEDSPSSGDDFTSPESGGQSEQLGFFKDYYSQDEIHPGDRVSTLWAYEPRAADEFHLERGDMIKVIGIWDDGWATGVRVRQRADDWRPGTAQQRDSGLTDNSSRHHDYADEGEVKAFPLVCVCAPQHWRKTIEGDTTESSGPAFP